MTALAEDGAVRPSPQHAKQKVRTCRTGIPMDELRDRGHVAAQYDRRYSSHMWADEVGTFTPMYQSAPPQKALRRHQTTLD
ncbi:hypothetical protein BST61_g7478 [Cercospora zeina]